MPAVVIKAKPTRSKSILKNRDSQTYVSKVVDPGSNEQQQSLLSKIKDIDGVMISSITNIGSSNGES